MARPTRFPGRKSLVVLAIVVLFAACDGDSEPNETDTTPPENTDATGELGAKLLIAGDLPPGWSEAPATPDPDVSDQDSGFCGEPVPDEANAAGSATVQFAKGEANPSRLVEALVAYETPEEATEAFGKVEQTVGTCKEWDLDEAGTVSRFKLARATFPNVGDQTVAVRITSDFRTTGGSANNPAAVTGFVVGDTVVVRQGNHIMVLRHFAIGIGEQPDFSSADTEPAARRAVEKLQAA